MMHLIVTGTGRCGTVYMARWLTSLGLPCSHEAYFDWRGLESAKRRMTGEQKPVLSFCSTNRMDEHGNWQSVEKWLPDIRLLQGEASYMAAPFLEHLDMRVLHVTRHPSKVINSFCNYINYFSSSEPTNNYEKFIYEHVPELTEEMPQYDRCALYYVRWNEMIEEHTSMRWPIEGDPAFVTKFLGLSGSPLEDKKINTFERPAKKFSVKEIETDWIKQELMTMSKRYGYSISENLFL